MHVDRIPNRTSPPAFLLRETYREGGKVKKRTLANITHWPAGKIEALRRLLRDELGEHLPRRLAGGPVVLAITYTLLQNWIAEAGESLGGGGTDLEARRGDAGRGHGDHGVDIGGERLGDTRKLVAPLLADKFTGTDSEGKVRGKAESLANAKATKYDSVDYDDVKVTAFGDTAIATGGFKAKGTDASGKPFDEHERWTDTWAKMPNGSWQCVASHGSEIKM